MGRNKRFEKICRMSETMLKEYLERELTAKGRSVVSGDGYLYSPGELPIMVCCHLDTVHKEEPRKIYTKKGATSSPQGIGGDDRCGVYMILKLIENVNPTPHIVFFEQEEVGCEGSRKFSKSEICEGLAGKINYVIEFDRKGNNDAVFYRCDNREFVSFVTKEFWKEAYGSFTDICEICPVLKCAGVNLSCGYYKPHTTDEYVVLDEMETSLRETIKLIARSDKGKRFEYIEEEDDDDWYEKYYQSLYSPVDIFTYEIAFIDKDGKECIYSIDSANYEEALGNFMIDNPDRCYGDVKKIEKF